MPPITNRMVDYLHEAHALPSPDEQSATHPFPPTEPLLFFPNGRAAMAAVFQAIGLAQEDEVLIANSFGGTYVSSCVTCTVFNICKPSRVLTDATRAIFVIHEYGVPHPDMAALLATARQRDIPLVEDCAHALDSSQNGIITGSRGDFALYSLPKVLPMTSGGLLRGQRLSQISPWHDAQAAKELRNEFLSLLPNLGEYTRRRRENFSSIAEAFPDLPLLFPLAKGLSPFFVGLLTPQASNIRQRAPEIGWGATMREDLLLVPTNPLIIPETLVSAMRSAMARCE